MKIAFIVAILLFSAFMGKKFGDYHKDRKNFFADYLAFLQELYTAVTRNKKTKLIIAANHPQISELIETPNLLEKKVILSGEEKSSIEEFLMSFGKSSGDRERVYIEEHIEWTEKAFELCVKKATNTSKSAPLIGVLCGLMAVVAIL